MALERNDAKVMRSVLFKEGVPNESAAKGTVVVDVTNADIYINTDGSTTWKKITRAT